MKAARAVFISGVLCLPMLSAVGPARAEEGLTDRDTGTEEVFNDYFRLTVGAIIATTTTTDLRVDASDGTPGTYLSGENDIGLSGKNTLTDVEAELRVRKRHRIRFNYFALDRAAPHTLTRQIQFGDNLYDIGDEVQSHFDMRDFTATYSYSFWQNARVDLAGSLSVHLFDIDEQAQVLARDLQQEQSLVVPLPVPGLQATVRLIGRWYAEGRVEYLSHSYDRFTGSYKNLRGAVFYRFNPNISVGAGYADLDIDVAAARETDNSGKFSFQNRGAEFFLRVAF